MSSRRVLAAAFLVGTLAGLAGCGAPEVTSGPPLVAGRALLCGQRVETARADAVVGAGVAGLHELNTFQDGRRDGECALLGEDGGALLSVQVVHDSNGKALGTELAKLSQQENYTGDDRSGVTGEGITTTALVAVDAHFFVRVLGLGGASAEQRQAALALAEEVAARTAVIR